MESKTIKETNTATIFAVKIEFIAFNKRNVEWLELSLLHEPDQTTLFATCMKHVLNICNTAFIENLTMYETTKCKRFRY